MRPLELTLEGFASYRTRQKLDFGELDNLFVITGPTGAGKTSVLDGITLALFGRVARAKKYDRTEFISIGCSSAKVQLDFRANGTRYRVAREIPREGSQSAALERVDESGEVRPVLDDPKIKDMNAKIEELIGLDFNAFTKAVLLPQGQFSEFLQGDKEERDAILTRLLDLDRFVQAGTLARRKARKRTGKADTQEELLEREFEDVTEEALQDLARTLESARERREELGAAVEVVETVEDRIEGLADQRSVPDRLRSELEEHETTLRQLAERWDEHADDDEATRERLEKAREEVQDARSEHEAAEDRLDEVQRDVGTAERLARLERAASTWVDERGRRRDLDERIDELKEQEDEQETVLEERQEDLKEAQEAEEETEQAREEARDAGQQASKRLDEARRRANLRATRHERAEAVRAAYRKHETAQAKLKQAQDDLKDARETHRSREREHQAASLKSELEAGDPCPVCERTLKDTPSAPEDDGRAAIDEAQTAVKEAEKTLAARREAADEARDTWNEARSRYEETDERLAEFDNDLPEVEAAEEALQQAREDFQAAQDDHRQAERELKKARAAVSDANSDLRSTRTALDEKREQREELTERLERAREELEDGFSGEVPDEPKAAVSERQELLSDAREALDEAQDALNDVREELENAREARDEWESEVGALDEAITEVRTELRSGADRLRRQPDVEVEAREPDWPDDLSREEQLESLTDWCDELKEAVGRSDDRLAERGEELAGRALSVAEEAEIAVDADQPTEAMEAIRSTHETAGTRVTQLESRRETLEGRLEARREYEEEIEQLRQEAARYRTLGQELRRDRFIQYALEEGFQELAVRASDRLKEISEGKYSLEADGSSFRVIDHANADKRRAAVTLSGGETFLASLSLALALAGGVQDLQGGSTAAASTLDSLFLDEGFGTLDADALDTVIRALETVQADDRMVGVITHVPDLPERIPSVVRIEPSDPGAQISIH